MIAATLTSTGTPARRDGVRRADELPVVEDGRRTGLLRLHDLVQIGF